MTPLALQNELENELKQIFATYRYKSPGTADRVPLRIFTQSLPVQESDEDEEQIPYLIIKLNNGADPGGEDSTHTVRVVIVIGVWDDALDAQGHRDVMNIIHKIYERFSRNPCLNGRAVYTGAFAWDLQEDGYYPYYFGACSMNFNIAAIRKEDELA